MAAQQPPSTPKPKPTHLKTTDSPPHQSQPLSNLFPLPKLLFFPTQPRSHRRRFRRNPNLPPAQTPGLHARPLSAPSQRSHKRRRPHRCWEITDFDEDERRPVRIGDGIGIGFGGAVASGSLMRFWLSRGISGCIQKHGWIFRLMKKKTWTVPAFLFFFGFKSATKKWMLKFSKETNKIIIIFLIIQTRLFI